VVSAIAEFAIFIADFEIIIANFAIISQSGDGSRSPVMFVRFLRMGEKK